MKTCIESTNYSLVQEEHFFPLDSLLFPAVSRVIFNLQCLESKSGALQTSLRTFAVFWRFDFLF